jgi:hypothetical protein
LAGVCQGFEGAHPEAQITAQGEIRNIGASGHLGSRHRHKTLVSFASDVGLKLASSTIAQVLVKIFT